MAKIVLFTCYDVICLGMRALSSHLKKNGHHVTMIFFKTHSAAPVKEENLKTIMYLHYLPGQIYANGYDTNPYTETELNLLIDTIASQKPDIIGLSTRTFWLDMNSDMTEKIRKKSPKSLLIAGGYGPSLLTKEFAEIFDYVCFGEGEKTLLDLANSYDDNHYEEIKHLNNIAYINNQKELIINPLHPPLKNLNELPFPDWDDENSFYIEDDQVISDQSLIRKTTWYDIFASRGCSSNCTYCMAGQWTNLYKDYGNITFPRIRVRNPENVIEELRERKKKYNLKYIRFMDSIFSSSEKWLDTFLALYIKEISLPFFCNIEVRFQSMSILEKLCAAGMQETSFGIQSGSERIRKEIYNRKISNEQIILAANFLTENKINYQHDIIGFNPFETEETLKETFDLLCSIPPKRTIVFHLNIFPNSTLEKLYQEKKPESLPPIYHLTWIYMWHLASAGHEYRNFAKDLLTKSLNKTPLQHHDLIKEKWTELEHKESLFDE
ncbi:B12-binding domain-containing radical SAM protein [Desulfobotulus mexicanus]|uniref:B12-binding domain-containing radical SAM protein n=1 Tax=Desulfobotulus mexicanus TaxID=2586642 RepID=A0A5Q4VF40_9BACT|nr:radical SAM protein [Desulfobotulus mexicanus]TYT76294.1 B12-binding domain-containing radical SAM protein [Desulfobotulus mexicanus]